jgi:hypothetical protein
MSHRRKPAAPCLDCGASLPEKPSGQRGGPSKRCAPCRRRRARAASKTWESRIRKQCDCGKPRALVSKSGKCRACYWAEHGRQIHVCEHCKQSFLPKRAVVPEQHQFNKYCSRSCFFSMKRRRALAAAVEAVIAKRLAREQEREQYAQRPCIWCLLPIGKTHPQRHESHAACQREIQNSKARMEVRRIREQPSAEHVCPACGAAFIDRYTDKRRVYCSPSCAKSLRKWRLGAMRRIPTTERNALARMIADAKYAQRIINDIRTGERTADRSVKHG